jgi:hypothetical protein
MKKIIISAFLLIICLLPNLALAQANRSAQDDAFLTTSQISKVSVSGMVSTIIQVVLSLLAIIFLILMFYAGYLWMMAKGNEDDVKKAKDIIVAAIIGLVIIAAAYSITYFVFQNIGGAVSGGGGNSPLK